MSRPTPFSAGNGPPPSIWSWLLCLDMCSMVRTSFNFRVRFQTFVSARSELPPTFPIPRRVPQSEWFCRRRSVTVTPCELLATALRGLERSSLSVPRFTQASRACPESIRKRSAEVFYGTLPFSTCDNVISCWEWEGQRKNGGS